MAKYKTLEKYRLPDDKYGGGMGFAYKDSIYEVPDEAVAALQAAGKIGGTPEATEE